MPELKFKDIPDLIANPQRAHFVNTDCVSCHSERNFKYFAGPIVPGSEGKGGEAFDENLGFPGNFYSKNITPAGISNWMASATIESVCFMEVSGMRRWALLCSKQHNGEKAAHVSFRSGCDLFESLKNGAQFWCNMCDPVKKIFLISLLSSFDARHGRLLRAGSGSDFLTSLGNVPRHS